MGFRFFKRFYLFPGTSINVGKSGVSFSFGVRGARLTISKSGIRKTIGLPGTGAYYTTYDNWNSIVGRKQDTMKDAEIDE